MTPMIQRKVTSENRRRDADGVALSLSQCNRIFPYPMDEGLRSELSKQGIFTVTLEELYNWGRRNSVWPLQFGLACCAIEMIAASMARFDIARFGAEVFRPSPRQADLMIVAGTVTKKMAPQVVRLYNQMPEPKYVIAMGACAISGGPFKQGYNVLKGID